MHERHAGSDIRRSRMCPAVQPEKRAKTLAKKCKLAESVYTFLIQFTNVACFSGACSTRSGRVLWFREQDCY